MDNDTNTGGIFSDRLEVLIAAALQDGVLTDKERELLKRRAEKEGEDWDEVEMIIEARLAEIQGKKDFIQVTSPSPSLISNSEFQPNPHSESQFTSKQAETKIQARDIPKVYSRFDIDKNERNVVVPEGIQEIDERVGVFSKMRTIKLPSTLHIIREYAFYSSKLEEVILPADLEEIGDKAFLGCENLRRVVFSKSLRKLGQGAFENCENLEEVDFSNCELLGSIDKKTFASCKSLKQIVLPSSLEAIEAEAFERCTMLKDIDLSQCGNLKRIGKSGFAGCENLRNVTFSETIESLGEGIFEHCWQLSSLDMSKVTKLATIPKGFKGTKDLIVPQGVINIEDNALSPSCAYELFLPNSLESFGEHNKGWNSIYLYAPACEDLKNLLFACQNFYVLPQYVEDYMNLCYALGLPFLYKIEPIKDEYLYLYDN